MTEILFWKLNITDRQNLKIAPTVAHNTRCPAYQPNTIAYNTYSNTAEHLTCTAFRACAKTAAHKLGSSLEEPSTDLTPKKPDFQNKNVRL